MRLTSGANVYYVRTFNWNSTGVQQGSAPDTTQFTVPPGLPAGTYSLVVTANGIGSDPYMFKYNPCLSGMEDLGYLNKAQLIAYPNPTDGEARLSFQVEEGGRYSIKVTDVFGRIIKEEEDEALQGANSRLVSFEGVSKGVYLIILQKGEEAFTTRLVLQ